MNTQIIISRMALAGFVAVGIGCCASDCEAQKANPLRGLVIQARTDKAQYVLGEPVSVLISIVNRSSAIRQLPRRVDVFTGEVAVLIAGENGPFREYVGPRWGLKDVVGGAPVYIAPGGVYTTTATLLFNHAIEVEHLSPLYARDLMSRRLDTPFALSEPGRFRIRAVLQDFKTGNKIESLPAFVRMSNPVGGDLAVWNLMKADPEYAYFVQTGGPLGTRTSDKTQRMVQNLDRLVKQHPEGRLAGHIASALSRHRQSVEALKQKGLVSPDR